MKIFATALAAAALVGLAAAGPASATEGENCRTEWVSAIITHPAVPAVTEVREVPAVTEDRVVPAVYVTEYEYIQRASQEGQPGQGAGTRWEAEGWNADGNPNSNGWIRTGEERQVLVTPETTVTVVVTPATTETVVLVPEVPAYESEEVVSGSLVCDTPAPVVPEAPAAPVAAPEAPAAPVVPAEVQAAPAAPAEAVPAQAVAAAVPAELAYTGAKEDALVATAIVGGALLAAGGAAAFIARPRRGAHRGE